MKKIRTEVPSKSILSTRPALGQLAAGPGSAGSLVWKPHPVSVKRQPRLFLADEIRRMGLYILAGKGSGKSRLMGRAIAWGDFIRGIPQVIFDPLGPTIDNLLDKINRLPEDKQRQLWPRIVYVDMSGKSGRVMPFPLYYRLGNESNNDVALRYLDAIERLDPDLKSAPMQGWNAIERVGRNIGIILAALGWQITEAKAILNDPELWGYQLQALAADSHDIGLDEAVKFLTTDDPKYWKSTDWKKLKESFETKIAPFRADNVTAAMFGAATPAIDWQTVIKKRLTVLLDFRHERNASLRRFKMLWAFLYFMAFLKERGAGRHEDDPIGLIVDEITAMYNFDSLAGGNIFANDFDELINQWARNANCWLTLAHQERFQINEKTRNTLLGMGSNIIGVTSDIEAALELAENLLPIDPHKVKRYENVWMTNPSLLAGVFEPDFVVIDKRPVEYSLEEQKYLNAYIFKRMKKFQFWVRLASGEGSLGDDLRLLTIDKLDAGEWVDDAAVAEARRQLTIRDGIPVSSVLAQIKARQQMQPIGKSATLAPDNENSSISEQPEQTDQPKPPEQPSSDTPSSTKTWRDDLVG